jgi:hypothetical protein
MQEAIQELSGYLVRLTGGPEDCIQLQEIEQRTAEAVALAKRVCTQNPAAGKMLICARFHDDASKDEAPHSLWQTVVVRARPCVCLAPHNGGCLLHMASSAGLLLHCHLLCSTFVPSHPHMCDLHASKRTYGHASGSRAALTRPRPAPCRASSA